MKTPDNTPDNTPDVEVVNFGCRLNSLESQIIKQLAEKAGLKNTVIINGCAVTNEAERQVKQALRKWIRTHPDKNVIATGCGVQLDKESYACIEGVNAVIGNQEKRLLKTYKTLAHRKSTPTPFIKVNDTVAIKEGALHLLEGYLLEGCLLEGHQERCRSFVEIQNGCKHRCTFCTIHLARGESRSHPESLILEQIGKLIDKGTQEIVLTGVDITAYGEDLVNSLTLGGLCQKILHTYPSLPRLRISSIDCIEADPLLLEVIRDEPRFMPHIHLSLQAGHDLILKRMLRRHGRDDAIAFCQDLRSLRPDIVLGSDFIVGFPSETEEMFEATLSLVDACGLVFLHVFPFSSRNKAPASRMPRHVRGDIIKKRAASLREYGKKKAFAWLETRLKTETSVLIETVDPQGLGKGKDPYFAPVHVPFCEARVGDRIAVQIETFDPHTLTLHASPLKNGQTP